MPRHSRAIKLDRRIRLIIWAIGFRINGVPQLGPVVFDDIVWSEKRSNVAEFERPSAGGSYITARESHVVRDLRVQQNGIGHPAVQPYAAGREFLVVDADDRSFVVDTVTEIGRRRFLELTTVSDEPFDPPIAGITFAGGVP